MRLIPGFFKKQQGRRPDVAHMRRDSIARGERVRGDLNPPAEESQTLESGVRREDPENFNRSGPHLTVHVRNL